MKIKSLKRTKSQEKQSRKKRLKKSWRTNGVRLMMNVVFVERKIKVLSFLAMMVTVKVRLQRKESGRGNMLLML